MLMQNFGGKQGVLWEMYKWRSTIFFGIMEHRFENDKQIIVVLSFFINSQKQENRLRY